MDLKTFFIETAKNAAKLSKCIAHQVGCVIVKDGRIISIGYNGTPSGFINCNEAYNKGLFIREQHHEWSLKHEIHAEINAITFAAKNGISTENTELYCTLEPCDNCMKAILQAGIKKVYYLENYTKKSKNTKEFDEYLVQKIYVTKV